MDDNCGERVECMDVVNREWVWLVGVLWNLWVWVEAICVLVGVVVRKYIDFLIDFLIDFHVDFLLYLLFFAAATLLLFYFMFFYYNRVGCIACYIEEFASLPITKNVYYCKILQIYKWF